MFVYFSLQCNYLYEIKSLVCYDAFNGVLKIITHLTVGNDFVVVIFQF